MKDIHFDLEFQDDRPPVPVSEAGRDFLNQINLLTLTDSNIYRRAAEQGLHVRFSNASVRDYVTATYRRYVNTVSIA